MSEVRNLSRPLSYNPSEHPSANIEWWYLYTFLEGSRGNRYAWVTAFFQVGELPILKGHYMIYSLIRLNEGKAVVRSLLDPKLALQLYGLYLPLTWITNLKEQVKGLFQSSAPSPHRLMDHASVKSNPTRLQYGDSRLTFHKDAFSGFQLEVVDPTFRTRLNFRPQKPIAPIDEQGTLNGFRYYSFTRNQVTGEIIQDGVSETVMGEGWFDHQWGRNYGLLKGMGWDWFGLQLKDGRELLINRLHPSRGEPPETPVAKLIGEDGFLATSSRVTLTPLRHWRSLYTGYSYPVEWQITLPEWSMELKVTPLLHNQEIPIIGPIKAIWEGACKCEGWESPPGGSRKPIQGNGFVELVGYAN